MLCLGQYPPFADAKRQQLSNLVRHRVLGEPAVGVTLCNSSHVLAEQREQVHAQCLSHRYLCLTPDINCKLNCN